MPSFFPASTDPTPGPVFEPAFEAAMAALDLRTLPRVNVQPEETAARVLASLPHLQKLLARASDDGRVQLDPSDLAAVRTAAQAVMSLSTALDVARAPDGRRSALARTALDHRTRLLRWARPLSEESLIPAAELGSLRATTGHTALVHDVRLLASILDARWETVARHLPFDRAYLSAAMENANLLALASERVDGPTHPARILQVRRDVALALLQRAWTRVRRVLAYVFWDAPEDADRWAPPWKPAPRRPKPRPPVDPAVPASPDPGAVPSAVPTASPLPVPLPPSLPAEKALTPAGPLVAIPGGEARSPNPPGAGLGSAQK